MEEDNVERLQEILDASEHSSVSIDLDDSEVLQRAEKHLRQEKRFKQYLSPVLGMKKSTVAEIQTYRNPLPVTHDVMTATFITLGDHPKDLVVGYTGVGATDLNALS